MVTYGQITRNDLVTVGTSSVIISQYPNGVPRRLIYIRNSSTGGQTITISFGNSVAVALYGVVLAAGESVADQSQEGYQCFQGVVSAVADGANGQVSIYEG
jgi:hypothetical protein